MDNLNPGVCQSDESRERKMSGGLRFLDGYFGVFGVLLGFPFFWAIATAKTNLHVLLSECKDTIPFSCPFSCCLNIRYHVYGLNIDSV